jgi:SMC interacting uncharacterized protein involved in chromosome segregation
MENSYTRWLEIQEEEEEKKEEEFTNLTKFAQKLAKTVEDCDNYYDAYEEVEELLKEFLKLNK